MQEKGLRGTLNYGPSKSWANFGAFVLVGNFYWFNCPLETSPSPFGFLFQVDLMWHGKWREIFGFIPHEILFQNPTLFFQGTGQVDSKGDVVLLLLFKHLFKFFSLLLVKCLITFVEKWKNIHLQKISLVNHHKVFAVKGFFHT